MENKPLPAPAKKRSADLGFALRWTLATVVGWFLALAVLAIQSVPDARRLQSAGEDGPLIESRGLALVLIMVLAGFWGAALQGLLLQRRRFKKAAGWVIVSTLAVIPAGFWLAINPQPDLAWTDYPRATALPVGLAQGLFLMWHSFRYGSKKPLSAVGLGLLWTALRVGVLACAYPLGFFLIGFDDIGLGEVWSAAILVPLINGLPFGFFCGLFLDRLFGPFPGQSKVQPPTES